MTLWDVKPRVEEGSLETLYVDELITQLRQMCEDAEDRASNAQEEAQQKRKEALEEVRDLAILSLKQLVSSFDCYALCIDTQKLNQTHSTRVAKALASCAVIMLLNRWFEKLESQFGISNVAEGDRVKFASSTLLDNNYQSNTSDGLVSRKLKNAPEVIAIQWCFFTSGRSFAQGSLFWARLSLLRVNVVDCTTDVELCPPWRGYICGEKPHELRT
ncbi:hypothetical protein Tco_0336458 [Tanacetum coccineum]